VAKLLGVGDRLAPPLLSSRTAGFLGIPREERVTPTAPRLRRGRDFYELLREGQSRLDALQQSLVQLQGRIDLSQRLLDESRAALAWTETTARIQAESEGP